MEQLDSIVAQRQQQPFKKLSDLKSIYGIGPTAVEELQKYLKPLPDEPVLEIDESVLFIPSRVYPVLAGGTLGCSDQQFKAAAGSRSSHTSTTNTTSLSDEGSDGSNISRINHYVLQTSINSLRVGELWADSGCVRAVGGQSSHEALRTKMATLGLQP